MTEAESKALKVGDGVLTTELPPGEMHKGAVVEMTRNGVRIDWDDGKSGVVDHRGMAKIQLSQQPDD